MNPETPRTSPTAPVSREGEPACPRCGSPLGDLRLGRCTRCGQRIDAAAELRFAGQVKGRVRMESPGAIDFGEPISAEWDLHCTQCGYSLTGLTSRVCPECGQAFRPRQTWLDNRQAEHESPVVSHLWIGKAGAAVLAGLVMGVVGGMLFRFWFGGVVAWGILEIIFWESDWNPYLVRGFFIPFVVTSVLLSFLL